MLRRALALALFLMTVTGGGFAQVQLGAVRLGYALDEAEFGLRPLIGTPGSAYLGELVPLPFPVRQAAVRGDTALVVAGEPGALTAFHLTGLHGGSISQYELAPAGRLWLNESGTLALLQNGTEVRLVSGLPVGPEVGPVVALEGLSAVAFESDRPCVVLASNIEGGGGVRLETLCADRPGELIWLRTIDGARSTAIAYTREAGLFLTDTNSRRILRIPAPIATEPVRVAAEEIDDALALAAISDSEVLAARWGIANLLLLSAAGASGLIELPTAPDRLDLLAASRLIACTGTGDFDPLLVIDLLQDRAPFFIPILRSLP